MVPSQFPSFLTILHVLLLFWKEGARILKGKIRRKEEENSLSPLYICISPNFGMAFWGGAVGRVGGGAGGRLSLSLPATKWEMSLSLSL